MTRVDCAAASSLYTQTHHIGNSILSLRHLTAEFESYDSAADANVSEFRKCVNNFPSIEWISENRRVIKEGLWDLLKIGKMFFDDLPFMSIKMCLKKLKIVFGLLTNCLFQLFPEWTKASRESSWWSWTTPAWFRWGRPLTDWDANCQKWCVGRC